MGTHRDGCGAHGKERELYTMEPVTWRGYTTQMECRINKLKAPKMRALVKVGGREGWMKECGAIKWKGLTMFKNEM